MIAEKCYDYKDLVRSIGSNCGLNCDIILAIISQESQGNPDAVRFEPRSSLAYSPNVFSKKLLITSETERNHQNTSWGLMQVMGFRARELGYDGYLHKMNDPRLGIEYGCRNLLALKKKYAYEEDMIAAYNAGSPLRKNGVYINKEYVDSVKEKWATIEKLRMFV